MIPASTPHWYQVRFQATVIRTTSRAPAEAPTEASHGRASSTGPGDVPRRGGGSPEGEGGRMTKWTRLLAVLAEKLYGKPFGTALHDDLAVPLGLGLLLVLALHLVVRHR